MSTLTFIVLLPIVIAACHAIGFALAFFLYDAQAPLPMLCRWHMGIDQQGQPCPILIHENQLACAERTELWLS